MQPTYRDHTGRAIFSSSQVQKYGLPENNGWSETYLVAEEEADTHPLTTTFKTAKEYAFVKQREIHRYCRVSRFRSILRHIMGNGSLSTKKSMNFLDDIVHDLPILIKYTPPCLLWDEIRKTLKRNDGVKYYSRIPTIIKKLELANFDKSKNVHIFLRVMEDFREMDRIFELVKDDMQRTYFPSLRFTALRLLDRHGYTIPIAIPYARTSPRVDRLLKDYDIFWDKLRELENEGLIDFFNFYFIFS